MSKRRPLTHSPHMGGRQYGQILDTRHGAVQVRPCSGDQPRVVEYTCRYGPDPLNGAWLAFAKDLRDGVYDDCGIYATNSSYDESIDTVHLYVFYEAASGDGPNWGAEPSPWSTAG
jgi:hypothetical protein